MQELENKVEYMEFLSFGHDRANTLRNSQQLGLPMQEQASQKFSTNGGFPMP